MIETHHDPSIALTDAKQQISPLVLQEILQQLQPRSKSDQLHSELTEFRDKLSIIDETLIELLQERMDLSLQIGQLKRSHNSTILQVERWEETKRHLIKRAQNAGLSTDFAEQFIKMLHEESLRIQLDLQNAHDTP